MKANLKAVISLAVGPRYIQMLSMTGPTHRLYAERIGATYYVSESASCLNPQYDKISLINKMLDGFESLIFLDCDMIVRKDCPNLFEIVGDKFGAMNESAWSDPEDRKAHRFVLKNACNLYNIDYDEAIPFLNTGMMVINRKHRPVFSKLPTNQASINYGEQPYINLRIFQEKVEVHELDYKFNRMYYQDIMVKEHRLNSYIVHYAGIADCFDTIKQDLLAWETL